MKLPILFALAFTMGASAQDAPKQMLPLPPFHESWSEQDKVTLTRLSEHLERFRQDLLVHDDDWPVLTQYLHSVVSSGECKAQFDDDGDTMARIAAMVDEADAVRLFLKRGEDINAVLHIENATAPVSLASEVIWAERLISPKQTAAERAALMQELQAAGWDSALHAPSVIFAIPIACLCESQDVSPLVEWFLTLNYEMNEEQKESFLAALVVAEGCTAILQRFVEDGSIKLNEPLGELLPLQHICKAPMFDKTIQLDNLEYLLKSGADPNLMLAYEDGEDDGKYDPEGYEEDDCPRDDMDGFSTPIEMLFDYYRFDMAWGEQNAVTRHKSLHVLAAMDLLLMHGAELEIELDECDDESAESNAYAETRKRLQMSKAELEADYQKLRELINAGK